MVFTLESFKVFGSFVNTSLSKRIEGWLTDPILSELALRIGHQTQLRGFLDSIAEAILADDLIKKGCRLEIEQANPEGYGADFKVSVKDVFFYIHIKRFETERPHDRYLRMPSRIRVLEKINRPFVAQVRWNPEADDFKIQKFVEQAEIFLQRAHIGDEMVSRDQEGLEYGGIRVMAPSQNSKVVLIPSLPERFVDSAPRIRKLLERSKRQFMPGAVNVSLIAMPDDDLAGEFEGALLGSIVERWDRHPVGGSRTAYGRSNDGFWRPGHHQDSSVCGWFKFCPGSDEPLANYGIMSSDAPLKPELWKLLTSILFIKGKIAKAGIEA